MIGYATIGTNNFESAAKFYDALLGEFGAKRAMEFSSDILVLASRFSLRNLHENRHATLRVAAHLCDPECPGQITFFRQEHRQLRVLAFSVLLVGNVLD